MKSPKVGNFEDKNKVVKIPLSLLESTIRRELYQEKLTCYIRYLKKILISIDGYFEARTDVPTLLSPEIHNGSSEHLPVREAFADMIIRSCHMWCKRKTSISPISQLYLQFTSSLCSLLEPTNTPEVENTCPYDIPILRAASEVVAINDKFYQLVMTYLNLYSSNLKQAENKRLVLDLVIKAKREALVVFNDRIEIYEE